jgi:hypothetical protein
VRFVCDVGYENPPVVLLALNPVTKTEVKISPPFQWDSMEELEIFARNFELYCQVSWQFGRLDPSKINASSWPKKSVMDALLANEVSSPSPPSDRVARDEAPTESP